MARRRSFGGRAVLSVFFVQTLLACSGSDSRQDDVPNSMGGRTATATGGTSAAATATGGTSAIATGGTTAIATGGTSAIATGGTSATATGGTSATATGGTSATATGGTSAIATGGTSAIATGGTSAIATGGTSAIATGGTSAIATGGTSADPTELPYRGVNLASAEFGESAIPGTHGVEYVYPTPVHAPGYDGPAYYVSKGMTVFRLPILWERLQRNKQANFDAAEMARLRDTVSYLTGLGADVIIDPHNYARYYGATVGSSQVPNEAFADLWIRLASEFKSNSRVIFGLMNEPNRMDTDQWVRAANAAIVAIRNTGAANLILVPGNRWTGAHSWSSSDSWGKSNADALQQIVDPSNNYAIEVHQYLDVDSSGTHPECPSAAVGAAKLGDFTAWLRQHGERGFLGEFGAGSGATCLGALDDLLSFIDANRDVWLGWTYWAGGPIWGDYFTSLEPKNGVDQPQMDVLEKHLGTSAPLQALPMDQTGWVDAASNGWGIQGAWYWYSDASTGGQTVLDGAVANRAPYRSAKGMCLRGTSPGGAMDDYVTWGAGIGLNVNQSVGSDSSAPLAGGPRCYRITLSGTSPAGFRAKLLPSFPMAQGTEAPGIDVNAAGVFDLCRETVARPNWCTDPSVCFDASSLTNGIAGINVQAEAGSYGGTIDYCIERVEPHE